ncbi:MAG: bifunctional precorrin-2 dehydrogenase/sirohydrochlorin ferrochelatase [Clostridiales bacterium]|nr:bifunctional precorrin-2 dehydrogenase/sirohydrochlorin ferrochelatase [Clostridiales bacterium]
MYFPLFLDLLQKEILVVGAGKIASRRIHSLCGFAGHITVVALRVPEEFEKKTGIHLCEVRKRATAADMIESDGTRITVFERAFEESDLNRKDFVLAATNDAELNNQIGALCRARGIPVNVCTDAKSCDFQFPSVIEDESIVIGLNASGRDHRLVKETRRRVEKLFENADFRSRYENR